MIHFDFDDRYLDELEVGSAISRREGVVLSVVVHTALLVAILFGPTLPIFQPSPEELEQQRQEMLRRQAEERERQRFVFVQPRVDVKALKVPDRAFLSDQDSRAQAAERSLKPQNPLPFSKGNTSELTDAGEVERARGPETPIQPNEEPPKPEPEERLARALPRADTGIRRSPELSRPVPGVLGDALRNLQRYVENQTFNNPPGGATDPGSSIQFDSKGVEFGPWVRRFRAQVYRNWFVPYAAMSFRGRVVLQFNVHRNGQITDLSVAQPSGIEAFNRAAYNAILGSNPLEPLPAEYPEESVFFTVTFYYNEPLPN